MRRSSSTDTEPERPQQQSNRNSYRIKKVREILSKISDDRNRIPDGIKALLEKWADNIFGLDHVRREGRGSKFYLDSPDSLHQLWGAAALLADMVDQATLENRELREEELNEAQNRFITAANSRKSVPYYQEQGKEIETIANNLSIVVQVMKRWNS